MPINLFRRAVLSYLRSFNDYLVNLWCYEMFISVLSANGDTKLVMKGISHGACDYLLKPVRMEELKNIWQHVIRRKKFDSKEKNKTSNLDKPTSDSGNGHGSSGAVNSDQNEKLTKKRKDQDEDEDEEQENDHDNEDPSTQKKPRVVWSVELHRKFVAAVNQLGIDSMFFTLLQNKTAVITFINFFMSLFTLFSILLLFSRCFLISGLMLAPSI